MGLCVRGSRLWCCKRVMRGGAGGWRTIFLFLRGPVSPWLRRLPVDLAGFVRGCACYLKKSMTRRLSSAGGWAVTFPPGLVFAQWRLFEAILDGRSVSFELLAFFW